MRISLPLCLILLTLAGCAREQPAARWVGADFFPMPLHDWQRINTTFIARPGSFDGRWDMYKTRLYHATATIGEEGSFVTQFFLRRTHNPSSSQNQLGIWLGLKSQTPSAQNVWIHPPKNPFFVGISPSGRLQVGDHITGLRLEPGLGIHFRIDGRLTPAGDFIEVTASSGHSGIQKMRRELPAGTLRGALSLFAQGKNSEVHFTNWSVTGAAVEQHSDRAVGPVLWTQYTLQDNGTLKLQAQMVPLEADDPDQARLEFQRGNRWETVATASLERASSTFLFRVEAVAAEQAVPYRVIYSLAGKNYVWHGTVRSNPRNDNAFTLAVFNCDHGELFPQDTMVRNVMHQDPDMLFFAGDQIYEEMDRVRVVREPAEGARLSYLSKYYQFGLTWRHLLKDRPSVIIPDDHDVFMPNVWGEHGLGYSMPADWVNMVQRTQTGSLPDPVDPAPVNNGINVYFTALDYAGMSFAIAEDRKFKTHPRVTQGIPKKLANAARLDVPQAQLLGARQLKFLRQWRRRTEALPVRWFLSQSMFSKGNTHNDAQLKRLEIDLDSNGWPQTARNRALRSIGRNTIMVNGDQHLGMLARLGIDTWDDGPLSFMVTGSSVGHPRAWWPASPPAGGPINGPYTGRYRDDLTNHLTVLGVTNPEPLQAGSSNAWKRPDFADKGVFAVQAAKGSGHGLVTVNKREQSATFSAFRLDFDATRPGADDQFPGFPITTTLR